LTGDGRLDIVTTNYSSDTVSVLLNNGATFVSGQTVTTDLRPFQTVVADVNGDGRPDLVTVSNQDSAFRAAISSAERT
jgi:hypothetical protein